MVREAAHHPISIVTYTCYKRITGIPEEPLLFSIIVVSITFWRNGIFPTGCPRSVQHLSILAEARRICECRFESVLRHLRAAATIRVMLKGKAQHWLLTVGRGSRSR